MRRDRFGVVVEVRVARGVRPLLADARAVGAYARGVVIVHGRARIAVEVQLDGRHGRRDKSNERHHGNPARDARSCETVGRRLHADRMQQPELQVQLPDVQLPFTSLSGAQPGFAAGAVPG